MPPRLRFLGALLTAVLVVPLRRLTHGPRHSTWTLVHELLVETLRRFARQISRSSFQDQRAAWEALAQPAPRSLAVRTEPHAGPPPGTWFLPADVPRDAPVVLYLHGGSYIYGSPRTHAELIARLARAAHARVLALDYRLAPEHPFPAALDDAVAAVQALRAAGTPTEHLVLAGDSAGGNLCLALLARLRASGEPLPAGAALLCPWVDLSASGGSLDAHAVWDWAEPWQFHAWARAFLGPTTATTDPLASPLLGDLHGLPPLLIQVGDAEMLYDQVLALAAKARAAGVEVDLRTHRGQVHDWHTLAQLLPAARQAFEEIGEFVRARHAVCSPTTSK